MSEERELELVAEYAKGRPILDLLAEFAISRPLLYKTLDKHAVPYAKRPRKNESPVDLAVKPGGVVVPEGGHVQSDVTSLPGAEGNGEGEKSDE